MPNALHIQQVQIVPASLVQTAKRDKRKPSALLDSASSTCSHRADASNSKRTRRKRITSVKCLTRDGWHYAGVDLDLFRKLKRNKAVPSSDGTP